MYKVLFYNSVSIHFDQAVIKNKSTERKLHGRNRCSETITSLLRFGNPELGSLTIYPSLTFRLLQRLSQRQHDKNPRTKILRVLGLVLC